MKIFSFEDRIWYSLNTVNLLTSTYLFLSQLKKMKELLKKWTRNWIAPDIPVSISRQAERQLIILQGLFHQYCKLLDRLMEHFLQKKTTFASAVCVYNKSSRPGYSIAQGARSCYAFPIHTRYFGIICTFLFCISIHLPWKSPALTKIKPASLKEEET